MNKAVMALEYHKPQMILSVECNLMEADNFKEVEDV